MLIRNEYFIEMIGGLELVNPTSELRKIVFQDW
jgi:hypothetical protein